MGIGGVGSNKGATALAMHVCSHPLCFVNCHLAAHEGAEYVHKRNANLSEMERDIKLGRAQARRPSFRGMQKRHGVPTQGWQAAHQLYCPL